MKLNSKWKLRLNFFLKQLEKTDGHKVIIETIQILLDENKTEEMFKLQFPHLNSLINSSNNADALAALRSGKMDVHLEPYVLDSLWLLGVCYENGFGVSKDLKQAAEFYKQAANLGHAAAITNLGFCHDEGLGLPKDKEYAIKLFEQAVKLKYAPAMIVLGMRYQTGTSVSKDLKRASDLFRQAAKLEHPIAIHNLAVIYRDGLGVSKDLKQAAELFRQAADLGYPDAIVNLGACYEHGSGVPKVPKKAAECYQKAANLGNAGAIANLGNCYEKGFGVLRDQKRAAEFYHQAIKLGNVPAMRFLAMCYKKGLGVLIDPKRAALLYQAIINNDTASTKEIECASELLLLGFLSLSSEKLPKIPNFKDAIDHYTIENDNRTLGFCYQMGIGVPQDLERAIKYYQDAIEPCYWDLLLCIKDLGLRNDSKIFMEFNELVSLPCKSEELEIQGDRFLCLAYLHERGKPSNFEQNVYEQNLYLAAVNYEEAAKVYKQAGKTYGTEKQNQRTMLVAFRNSLQKEFQDNQFIPLQPLVEKIADYAFESTRDRSNLY